MTSIDATWMRGGTSKCWVFDRSDLEVPDRTVDEVLLRVYGSPDPRQVDGIGGGTSTTCKAVIVSPSDDPRADVDYTFAQVGVEEATVDWGSNCGNCSAVVGLHAVTRGWVTPDDGVTAVRVLNTNTDQVIVQEVPTPHGVLDESATEVVPGVPFAGTGITMWFVDPAGRTTGDLLPTGRPSERIVTETDDVTVTMLDAGAPLVVLDAHAVGLTGRETADELDSAPAVLARLEAVRRAASVAMGLSNDPASAARAVPKLALVAAPVDGDVADVEVRMLSMGRAHPALPITGSVGLTLAARTAGTVVAAAARRPLEPTLRLRTPAGILRTRTGEHAGSPAVAVSRTARRLAVGSVLLPDDPAAWTPVRATPETTPEDDVAGATARAQEEAGRR